MEIERPEDYDRYQRALKKVEAIKGFYGHLQAYLIVNGIFILGRLLGPFVISIPELGPDAWRWIDINIFGMPVVWGIGLAIHGLVVFRYKIPVLKDWEERKIRQIMEDENSNSDQRWS